MTFVTPSGTKSRHKLSSTQSQQLPHSQPEEIITIKHILKKTILPAIIKIIPTPK
jgi:hypothetical protein